MTDQLEHDLRTLLAERASTVTADVTLGETAIGDRLRAGDAGLADVVAIAGRSRRAWGLAAVAAAVVVAVVGAAVVLQDRDTAVVTSLTDLDHGRSGFFAVEGSPEDVARAYLVDRLGLEPADLVLGRAVAEAGEPAALAGATWELASPPDGRESGGVVVLRDVGDGQWVVVESYSDGASIDTMEITADHVVVHASGPGTLNLSAHAIAGDDPEVASSSFCAVGTAIGGSADATTTEPALADCDVELEVDLDLLPATVRLIVTDAGDEPLMLEERLIDDTVEASAPSPGTATTETAPAGHDVATLEFRPVATAGPCAALGGEAVPSFGADAEACYVLGDALPGNELIASAQPSGSGGAEATLILTPDGVDQVDALAQQCYERAAVCPTGQLAIVLNGEVLSAPAIVQPSLEDGQIEIHGPLTDREIASIIALLDRSNTGGDPGATATTTRQP